MKRINKMWDVGCGMWDVRSGVWGVGCGVWDVGTLCSMISIPTTGDFSCLLFLELLGFLKIFSNIFNFRYHCGSGIFFILDLYCDIVGELEKM